MIDPRPLVGTPYRWGGRDVATGLDCWGLVLLLVPDLPDFRATSLRDAAAVIRANRDRLRRVDQPAVGDVLVLGVGGAPAHVGVLTDYGVAHALRGLGVVLQPLAAVIQQYPQWEARRWG